MIETTLEQKLSIITEMTARSFMQVLVTGLVAGVVAGGLTLLFSMYVFRVMPCSGEVCGAGGQYSAVLAGVISGFVALFWLIRLQVFRPLLVVMAVTIGLWGISIYILNWPWYYVVLISALLHGVAYSLFTWISRIRMFWLVVALIGIVVVGLRLILMYS